MDRNQCYNRQHIYSFYHSFFISNLLKCICTHNHTQVNEVFYPGGSAQLKQIGALVTKCKDLCETVYINKQKLKKTEQEK